MRRPPARPPTPCTRLVAGGLAGWLAASSALAGPPEPVGMALPGRYATDNEETAPAAADAHWLDGYGSAELASLVATARQANPAYAAATARTRAARAQARATGTLRQPTADAIAGGTHYGGHSGNGTVQETDSGVGVTLSYDVDLFGQNRARVAAAQAALAAAEADEAATTVSSDTAVVSAYVEALAAQARARLAQEDLAAARSLLTALEARREIGTLAHADLLEPRAAVATAALACRTAAQQVQERRVALAAATGLALADLPALTAELSDLQDPEVRAGLPADLLRRRPDVRAAEQTLAAAHADLVAARAALWPSLALTVTGGVQNPAVQAAVATLAGTGLSLSLGASLVQTVFDGGRRAAVRDVADARQDELLAAYRGVIRTALDEVETALAARAALVDEEPQQAASLDVAERSLATARARLAAGQGDRLAVATAERSQVAARMLALQYRTDRLQNSVQLIRALGGGYGAPNPAPLHPTLSENP